MSHPTYQSDIPRGPVAEDGEVLAGHRSFGEAPLVCRWPREHATRGAIVFCHGLGSNGGEYASLSAHWAAHGYLVIHPTFSDAIGVVARKEPHLEFDPDTEPSRWITMPTVRKRMHEILHSPERWMERVAVVDNVVDVLPAIMAATCGASQADMPLAVAGHSFGAYTAQLLAGAEIDMPNAPARRFIDERFKAAILLSAQGRDQQGLRDGSWDAVNGPVLTVTGTLDRGAKGGDWHWKSEPYELAPAGGKYLAVLDDGDHYLGGFTDRPGQRQVPAQQEAVNQLTLAFLDAHVRDRQAARDWLGSIGDRIGECQLLFKRK